MRKLLCFELSESEYEYLTQIVTEEIPISKLLFALVNSIREGECHLEELPRGEWRVVSNTSTATVINNSDSSLIDNNVNCPEALPSTNNNTPPPEVEEDSTPPPENEEDPTPPADGDNITDINKDNNSLMYGSVNIPFSTLPVITNLVGLGKLSDTQIDEDEVLDILDSLSYELYNFFNDLSSSQRF